MKRVNNQIDVVNLGMVMNPKATKQLSANHLHDYELETAS